MKQSAGLGALAGLTVALWLATSGTDVGIGAGALVLGGAVLGAGYNFWAFQDDKVCRVPWWLWGCGNETTVKDSDGHSRPKRPCWAHPNGKPKRVVNLLVVAGEVAAVVVLVAVVIGIGGVRG